MWLENGVLRAGGWGHRADIGCIGTDSCPDTGHGLHGCAVLCRPCAGMVSTQADALPQV